MYHYCILLSSPSTCLSNLLFIRMWVLVVVCLCMLEPIEVKPLAKAVASRSNKPNTTLLSPSHSFFNEKES